MNKELDDGIERNPAEKNPWYWLMQKSISLDEASPEPAGWHWLVFLHYLGFNIFEIQKIISDEHPLKSASLPTGSDEQKFKSIIDNFYKILGHPENMQKIDFSNLIFNKYMNFSNFIFPLPVDFKNTIFEENAIFVRAFFREAIFSNARFSNKALFAEIESFIKIIFSRAIFSNDAHFNGAKFNGIVQFINTKFSGVTLFTDATFKQTAHFIDAQFETHVPNFYNATLSPDIVWEWDSNCWPQTKKHKNDKTDIHYSGRIIDNQTAYENLSSQMKNLDKYHDEHFFYRQETRCRRSLARPLAKCFYWLYENLANYGYGIERAIVAWSLHILLGAVLIGATTKSISNKTCDLAGNFYLDMIISFSNAHGVLFFSNGLLKECYDTFKMLLAFKFIWGIQTILGIIFLFLVLLTLRIRFRLK